MLQLRPLRFPMSLPLLILCPSASATVSYTHLVEKAIEWLLKKTQKIADDCIEFAAKRGVEVVCYVIEVEIGGYNVLIDPMRVAGL